MKEEDYKKCQKIIYEENKIIIEPNFLLLFYINYSSKKGIVKDKKYKTYDKNSFSTLSHEYFELKKNKKFNEISSCVERSKMSENLRYDILKRDNFKFQICGAIAKDGAKLQVDHIIPVSKGGKIEKSNLRTLCSRCNIEKK